MKKVLLIRLDKIGDLISTMCVDQASFCHKDQIQWVISSGMGFIPQMADPPRNYLELSKQDSKVSLKKLRTFIREFKPDIAVSFQAPWWVNFALWIERVPVRAGVLSQWHSFLFLNEGLRQKRSRAVQHEADYNMDLLKHAYGIETSEPTPILKLKAPVNSELLQSFNLKQSNYVVVHPGMAGSALNWPIPRYIELIQKLAPQTQVVLTGTPADEPWLTEIKTTFNGNSQVLNLQSKLKPAELFTVLRGAKAVVVPSTGVAHMAASLGVNVLGLYSPLKVQHPRRWAARGEKIQIFVPKTESPDCMNEISVQDLLKAINSL